MRADDLATIAENVPAHRQPCTERFTLEADSDRLLVHDGVRDRFVAAIAATVPNRGPDLPVRGGLARGRVVLVGGMTLELHDLVSEERVELARHPRTLRERELLR